jgi:hypothetical protein
VRDGRTEQIARSSGDVAAVGATFGNGRSETRFGMAGSRR